MNILAVVADCGTFKIERKTGSSVYLSNAGYATKAAAYAMAQRRASYEPNTVAVSDPLGMSADLDALRSGKVQLLATMPDDAYDALEDERPGYEFCTQPYNF